MDMLTRNELQIIIQQANKDLVKDDNDCWIWRDYGKPQRQRAATVIYVTLPGRGPHRYELSRIMWQWHYNSKPLAILRCTRHPRCINPEHCTPTSSKSPLVGYKIQRHTEQCAGPDWVVVQRIMQAGTITTFTDGHIVCDCERAYIVTYHPENANKILNISSDTKRQLAKLGETL